MSVTTKKVVMAPAWSTERTYFIFRSAYEQVKITITEYNRIVSSHTLYPYEITYIKETYPFILWDKFIYKQ